MRIFTLSWNCVNCKSNVVFGRGMELLKIIENSKGGRKVPEKIE